MALNKVNYQSGKTVITAENLNNIQDSIIELEKSEIIYLTGTLPEWQDRIDSTSVNFTADKSYSEVLNMLKKGRNISFEIDNTYFGANLLLPVISFNDETIGAGAVGGGIQVNVAWYSSNEFEIAWCNLDNETMKIRFYNYDEDLPDTSHNGSILVSCNVTFEELLNYHNNGNIIECCELYWHDQLLDTVQFRRIDSGAIFANPIANNNQLGFETIILFPDNTGIAQIQYLSISDSGSGSSDDTLVVTISGTQLEDLASLRGFLIETDWVANYDYDTVLNSNKNIVFDFSSDLFGGVNRSICTFKNDYMIMAGSFMTQPYCGISLMQWNRENNKIYMTTSLLEEEIVPTFTINSTTQTATCDCEYDWLISQVHDNGYYINRANIVQDGVYQGLLHCVYWPASDTSFWFRGNMISNANKVPCNSITEILLHEDDTVTLRYLNAASAPLEDLLWSSNSPSVGQSSFISADLANKYHALKITGIIDYNPSDTREYILGPDRIISTQGLKITLPTHTNYNSPNGVEAIFDCVFGERSITLWSNGFMVMPGSYDENQTASNYAASPSKIYGLRYDYSY